MRKLVLVVSAFLAACGGGGSGGTSGLSGTVGGKAFTPVEVKAIPGKSGAYNAVAYLRPWLQMEELTASLRLVANIPPKAAVQHRSPTNQYPSKCMVDRSR